MRIAYVANYQGPTLVAERPGLHNFSLAARVKIQLIAELLQRSSHEVEIISQGQLEPQVGRGRFRLKRYPSLVEGQPFSPEIPIHYASAIAVKYLTGFWESVQTRRLLSERHAQRRFDLVIIYNLQRAQVGCALHAVRSLGVPVVLQYEDDSFVDVHGHAASGLTSGYNRRASSKVLKAVSGGTGVSPYLLSQMPSHVPKLLLRGIVSDEIRTLSQGARPAKKDWVVFSGTHEWTQGLEQLVQAWRSIGLPGWELHIAGYGPLTPTLQKLAEGDGSVVFHGLLNREENARLLCAAKIGMNPQDLTRTPGNVFAFKIIEYLAAGVHVITTPRGAVEPELEAGISYIPDNSPGTIAACLRQVMAERRYEKTAEAAALRTYGPEAVTRSLNALFDQVVRQ